MSAPEKHSYDYGCDCKSCEFKTLWWFMLGLPAIACLVIYFVSR